jgi:hypothetical protein
MRYGFIFMIGVALVGLGATQATAQPRVGTSPPPFSPYLNIVRPGGSPTLNYYGLVRPEVQARQSLQSLQSQVGTNSQAINDLSNGPLPATGKIVGFMNYGRYFQNFNPPSSTSTGGFGSTGGLGGSPFGTTGSRPIPPAAPRR